MNLKEIVAVSGKKGLYKLISHDKNRMIVESLADKTRMPVFVSSRPSALDNISIFMYEEDMTLQKAFKIIFQANNSDKVPENRISNDIELKKYMEEVFPEYDKNRVHVSDMKKLFAWYNILHENSLLVFDDTDEETETNTESDKN
jgi:hypothetical protein